MKNEGKRLRDSKESVMEKLFAAFEKHQYYNVKDLVRVTNQPIVSTCIDLTVQQNTCQKCMSALTDFIISLLYSCCM